MLFLKEVRFSCRKSILVQVALFWGKSLKFKNLGLGDGRKALGQLSVECLTISRCLKFRSTSGNTCS